MIAVSLLISLAISCGRLKPFYGYESSANADPFFSPQQQGVAGDSSDPGSYDGYANPAQEFGFSPDAYVPAEPWNGIPMPANPVNKPQINNNQAPSLTSLDVRQNELLAVATDPENDRLAFHCELVSGNVEFSELDNSEYGQASWQLADADGMFLLKVTVTDARGKSNSGYCSDLGELLVKPDSLYVVASQRRASVGDAVRVMVISGRTASPFQFMNGCGVVCEEGADYRRLSLDIGAPDAEPDLSVVNIVDGIWKQMGVREFLLAPDSFIVSNPIANGRLRTDFNITPLDGSSTQTEGELFNFEYVFNTPGTYMLGLEGHNVVDRTYYQDWTAVDNYTWSDIRNVHPMNFVVVE
ncbi:hypothetical protein KDL44_00520 [bacterium]|nr:hypothetical protein [bacterium]